VSIPPFYSHSRGDAAIYMGRDSLFLANSLSIPKDSCVLDLFTGSGIQAIVSAPRAKKVVGVELQHMAARAATWNTIMDDVEDRVEIREGDLFEAVGDERFDVIIANPPFVPVACSG